MNAARVDLVTALEITGDSSLVSIVGGGGKSALLFALASLLPGRVVLTTTTRIFREQIERASAHCMVDSELFESVLQRGSSGLLIVGGIEGEKAFGVSPRLPGELFRRADVDHVIVEADGSRMLPAKAPAEHEPVVAAESTHVVVATGIDALEGSILEKTHRPERVSKLVGIPTHEGLTPDGLAQLLSHKEGGLKGIPSAARVIVMINKVETPNRERSAEAVARACLKEGRIDRVIVGALSALPKNDWTLYTR